MKEKVLKMAKAIHNTSRFVKLICIAGLCLAAIVVSLKISGVRSAYALSYGGNNVAVVAQKSDFEIAKANAMEKIVSQDKESLIYTPEFSTVLTLSQNIDSCQVVEQAILEETKELILGTVLTVDGDDLLLYGDKAELEEMLNQRLTAYNVDEYESKSEFLNSIDMKDVYCKKEDYASKEKTEEALSELGVKTVVKYTTDVVTGFSTVTEKTSKKLIGYVEVAVNGENGLNHEIEEVELINGVETNRTKLAQEVVKEPVNKVVLVGTGTTQSGNKVSGLLYPLSRNARCYISTYFGEIELGTHIHKGVDYAVAKGTPIYAAAGGVVTRSCYRSDYGKCIIINHGNGLETLYAHCNDLYVKEGETVVQGQTIGTVGTTGQSTGYHLHFEVISNGGYVNPLNYIS